MADKDDLIQQFIGVTQTDPDRARFYLESSAWNLEVAMSSFWDSACDGPDASNAPPEQAPSASDVSMPTALSRNQDASRVTISSMSVDSGSSDEEGQAYYAGGSDRSGQQVIGPPKKKDTDKLVNKLFKSARDHGAEEKRDESGPSKSSKPSFVGAGYRLGETNDDTTVIPGASLSRGQKQVDKKLKLWKNGFSVDDGELRDYNDPNNKQFLSSISKGEIPHELVREAKGGEVNLDMEDHRGEDFVRAKAKVKAFSGAGHMLGSPAPDVQTGSSGGDAHGTAGGGGGNTINVDQSKPITSVQLRLADGSRQVLKMNHSHTVQDIRQHIISSNPQYAQSNFCLMTTFPNKELTEEAQTLEDAKLLNAVIVQRMK